MVVPNRREENLRHAQNSLRQEKLGHGRSIYNIFALLMAGLLVLLGGIIAAESINNGLKAVITASLVIVLFFAYLFLRSQRNEAAMCIAAIQNIDRLLDITDILPEKYKHPLHLCYGLTCADWLQVFSLVVTVAVIITTLWLKSIPI